MGCQFFKICRFFPTPNPLKEKFFSQEFQLCKFCPPQYFNHLMIICIILTDKNMVNGDPRGSPSAAESMGGGHGGDSGYGGGMQHSGSGKKLGGMMACMPQKQRDFFQRIQQQHSLQDDDDMMEGNMDDAGAGASNVNWYSSDEDGEGPSSNRPPWQVR